MIAFLLFLIAVVFLTSVFFYKQTNTDFHILQMEESQMEKLSDLTEERQPVVIRGTAIPHAFTSDSLGKIPRLGDTPIATTTLTEILEGRAKLLSDGPPAMTREAAAAFANEISLEIWTKEIWSERLRATSYIGWMGTCRTFCGFGGVGLFKTTAMLTLILPTEGIYYASLVPKSKQPYLPKKWQYRFPSSFTMNDTPLVSELQFVDIKLKPGTGLILPPHTYISLQSEGSIGLYVIIEYHEPISMLASAV